MSSINPVSVPAIPPVVVIPPMVVVEASAPATLPAEQPRSPDLEARIAARRTELIAELDDLRADARIEAVEAADKLKARLSQLGHIIRKGVVDGWANLSEAVTAELDGWLAA